MALTTRLNGQNITAEFFNDIKDELENAGSSMDAYALLDGRSGDIIKIDEIQEFTTENGVLIDFVQIINGAVYAGVDGTSSVTAIGRTGDIDTGLYFPSANNLGISAGGTQRLNVNSSGLQVDTIDSLTGSQVDVEEVTLVGGVVRANIDGSAAFPAFSFNDDVNTGMFRSADDTVALGAGGNLLLTANTVTGVDVNIVGLTLPNSASGDANTLDWYEEGTWTPVLTGSTGGTTGYSTQSGVYTRIGRTVQYQGTIATTSWSVAPTGNAQLQGLPFTVSGSSAPCSLARVTAITFAGQLTGYAQGAASYIDFYQVSSGGTAPRLPASNINVSGILMIVSGTYTI